MRAATPLALLLLVLTACEPIKAQIGDSVGLGPDDSGPPDSPIDTQPEALSLAVEGTSVFDPVLGADAAWTLTVEQGALVRAELQDGAGAVVRTLADGSAPVTGLAWDGTDSTGALAAVGTFSLVVTASLDGYEDASVTVPVGMVRLGVDAGTLGGEDRIPLLWHRGTGEGGGGGGGSRYYVQEDDELTFKLSALVDEAGEPVAIPEPWDDLDSAPSEATDQNMPAAFPYDAAPTLTLSFGGQVGDVPVNASIEGWTASSAEVVDDGTLVFTRDGALAEGPRVVEEVLTVVWSSGDEVVATQDIPLRMYATLGAPTFDSSGSPYYPWVAIVDPALRAIDGVEPTDEAVISGLVEHIFNDLGLSYDTRYGASAYMSYGWSWDSARFNMSGFLARSNGDVVNCSDCSGILTAFANMLGAYLGQSIIEPSFSLNYILAIGGDAFTHCPFGGYGCGFSYHAVTSPDANGTIYDATLALDGDEDPSNEPNEVLMVQAITGDEYMDRLVMSGTPAYESYGTGEIQ